MDNDTPTPPSPGPAPDGRPRRRLGRLGIAVIAATVGVLTITAAMAVATSGGDDRSTTAASTGTGNGTTSTTVHDHAAGVWARRHARHRYPALTPYDERYDKASAAERQAADELRAAVAKTVAKYEDPATAVADGFRAPRRPRAKIAHYLNLDAARDGKVLDPEAPEGLVYYTGGPKPVLLGAFFLAPPGEPVPDDTGGIVVWHSHDPACTGFFATPEAPCTAQRRMLHVWTFDKLTLTRPDGQTVTVELTDPFGAPLPASVRKAA